MDNKWITKVPKIYIFKKNDLGDFLLSNIYGKKVPKSPREI